MNRSAAAFAILLLVAGSQVADAAKPDRLRNAEGLRIYELPTDSMQPAIRKGDKVLVDERAYMLDRPLRGDVVVYLSPADGQTTMLKRVVGLPGETVRIQHKKLTIDGRELAEAYAVHTDPADLTDSDSPNRARDSYGPVTLKAGEYFLLGDNRDSSVDSRAHGPVMRGLIHAKAIRVRSGETVKEMK